MTVPSSSAWVHYPVPDVVYRSDSEVEERLKAGEWSSYGFAEALRSMARSRPSAEAVVGSGERLTWSDLDRRSDDLALGLLGLGLRPTDRVLIQLGAEPSTIVVFAALFKAGILPVCAVPQYRDYEMGALCLRSQAVAHFIQPTEQLMGLSERLRSEHPTIKFTFIPNGGDRGTTSLREVEGAGRKAPSKLLPNPGLGDLIAFQLSGGTTGVPKIIPRYHGEYLGYAAAFARRIGLTSGDRFLWALPLSHNAGMILVVLPSVITGATIVLMPRFDPEAFLQAIAEEGVTVTGSIGPIAPRLLAIKDMSAYDLSTLRYLFALNRAAELEAHLGVATANVYGTTEGILLASHPGDPQPRRHLTVGAPVAEGDEVVVRDVDGHGPVAQPTPGEMCFRGPSQLTGYYLDPTATAEALTEDGWVRTGDLVAAQLIDGVTCFSFEGRIKDNIDRGGEKFGTEELELLIESHPSIKGCAVVSMPDPMFGERACAFLIVAPGSPVPTVYDLGNYLLAKGVAKFKLPERIEAIGEFPVTGVGKLDRPALRQRVAQLLAVEAAEKTS